MIELLSNFSIPQIILFIVLLAIAFKKIADFLDWFSERVTKRDNQKHGELIEEQQLHERLNNLEVSVEQMTDSVNKISHNLDTLINSDRDDIKAFITREHHYFCYQKGWIDDYSLDCLEKRYEHYIEEKGNSFIKGLMEEVRALPKQEPDSK